MKDKLLNLCIECLRLIKDNYDIDTVSEMKDKGQCDFCGKKNIWGWIVVVHGKTYQSRNSKYAKAAVPEDK